VTNSLTAAALTALTASAAFLTAAPALADTAANPLPAGQHELGAQAQIGDSTWTVSNLKPSSDAIPYHPAGTLWEATATAEATHGSTTPVVSNFNARARSGQTYRELFQIATPAGVNPAGLAQGQQASGKFYFDVTGDTPDSVTYNAGGPDLALWVQPPPSPRGGGSATRNTPAGASSTGMTPTAPPAAQPAARPGGSAGTVIPGAAQGTAAPGAGPGPQPPTAINPAPAAAGTPVQAPGEPAPGNLPAGPVPAPAASPGPQVEPGAGGPAGGAAPGAPTLPGAGAPGPGAAPAPASSQGTALQPGTEQPSPGPANPQPVTAPAANAQPAPSPTPPPAG
jgi:hypothetical protein